jgi:hypothetical protein
VTEVKVRVKVKIRVKVKTRVKVRVTVKVNLEGENRGGLNGFVLRLGGHRVLTRA